MLTREENELLCRVGPEAPMGKMLRRYWLPAIMSSELVADGTPKRVRLLGENLQRGNVDGEIGCAVGKGNAFAEGRVRVDLRGSDADVVAVPPPTSHISPP